MRAKTFEQIAIRKIEVAIRCIKFGAKPSDTKAGYFLNKLANINEGMHNELMEKYKIAVANSKCRTEQKNSNLSFV